MHFGYFVLRLRAGVTAALFLSKDALYGALFIFVHKNLKEAS